MSPCARLALVCILPDTWGCLSRKNSLLPGNPGSPGPLAATCPVGCRPGVQTPVLGCLSLRRAGMNFYICAFSASYLWCGIEGAVTSDSPPPSVSLRGHLMQPTIIPLQRDSVNERQWEETQQSQDPVLISMGMPSEHNGLSPWPREQPTGLRRRKACTEAPLFRRRYSRAPHGRLDDPRQSGRSGDLLSLPPPRL